MATGLLSYPVCRWSCCVCVCVFMWRAKRDTLVFLFISTKVNSTNWMFDNRLSTIRASLVLVLGVVHDIGKKKRKNKITLYRVKSVASRFGRSLAMIYVAQRAHFGCTLLHTVSCWKSHRHQKHVTIDRINRAEQFVGAPSCCQGAKHGIITLILVAMFRVCMCVWSISELPIKNNNNTMVACMAWISIDTGSKQAENAWYRHFWNIICFSRIRFWSGLTFSASFNY